MKVAVFGGGVAGLMAAITLQSQGHSCSIYERSLLSHHAGMGFILMPAVAAYMKQFDINISGDCSSVFLDRYICRDANGKVLREKQMPRMSRSIRRCELVNLLLDRGRLHDAIKFDAELEQLEFDGHGHVAAAVLRSGERVTADLFIGADGSRSRIRRVLFPEWPTAKARVLEIVGLVHCPEAARWAGRNFNKFHASGGGLALGILPVGADDVVWFMQFDSLRFPPPDARDTSGEEWRDFVQTIAGTWAFPVSSVLANTDSRNMHTWFPVEADLPPYFHHKNLVLIGDAAQPLSPFTSQGVCSAIGDAVTLADMLLPVRGKRLLEKALALYSKQRRQQRALYLRAGHRLVRRFLAPVSSNTFGLPLAI